jgi:site-specific DNA-methyltransferase (cytosine-N4-specific)
MTLISPAKIGNASPIHAAMPTTHSDPFVVPTQAAYETALGRAFHGDAHDLLRNLGDATVDLVITSPPFALQRQKAYGNKDQGEYVDWLCGFGADVRRVLKDTGSYVVDLGGAYQRGLPVRSLHQFRFLLRLCDEFGFYLAQEFYWHNPSKLPSPIEWVNKRKLRVKDTVNTVWWLSKTPWPQADVRQVLVEYSDRMKRLLADAASFYQPKERPSGHQIAWSFDRDNGGAIPSHLLQFANTESNSHYLRCCKAVGAQAHPARFPLKLPDFFIRLLTTSGATVLDIFAGSNTTGEAAEALGRRWLAFELDRAYVASSAFRFVSTEAEASAVYDRIVSGQMVRLGGQMALFEQREASYSVSG